MPEQIRTEHNLKASGMVPPDWTPWWGKVHHQTEMSPGIWLCSTASHGGVWVDPNLRDRIPEEARTTDHSTCPWYEEDCDAAIPVYLFTNDERDRATALESLQQWHPELVPVLKEARNK
jgi:hypothetical protein